MKHRRRHLSDHLRFARYPIGQALVADSLQGVRGTFRIFDAKSRTIVIAKVEFGEIAVQVIAAPMLIYASHAAFEHREEAFNGIGIGISAHVLASAAVDRSMLRRAFQSVPYGTH